MMPLLNELSDTAGCMMVLGALGFVRLMWVRMRMLGAMGVVMACLISAAAEPPEKPIPKALPVADDELPRKPLTKMLEEEDKELARMDKKRPPQGAGKVAPAVARYSKLVISQVERKWHLYLRLRPEGMNTGEIEIVFYVTKKGKVEGLKVINDKHSTPVFTEITKRAIEEAEIPPIPADVIPLLPKEDLGRLKINFHAILY